MKKRAVIWLVLMVAGICSPAQSIHSISDGSWFDPATWDLGRIPQQGDSIWITQLLDSDQTIRIDSGTTVVIEAAGFLCMVNDSFLFDCGTYLLNHGIVHGKFGYFHSGFNDGCLWLNMHVDFCTDSTLFHFSNQGCPPPNVCQDSRGPALPDSVLGTPNSYITTILYPNPTVGDISVRITSLSSLVSDEMFVFTLYDLLGRRIFGQDQLIFGENPIVLPANLAKGAYLWHVHPQAEIVEERALELLLVR